MLEISRNVAAIMAANGITQTDMARRIGTTQANLSAAINAENPTIKTLQKIATALNCTVVDLLQPQNTETKTTPAKTQQPEQTNAAKIICPHCGKPFYICIVNDK